MVDIKADSHHRKCHYTKIHSDLLVFKRFLYLPEQDHVVNIEINTEKQHPDPDSYLYGMRIIDGKSHRTDAESSGSRRSEGIAKSIINRHSQYAKYHNKTDRHCGVYAIQYSGGILHSGHQLAGRRTRYLSTDKVHRRIILHGKQHQYKYQYSHSSDPVTEASEELHSFSQNSRLGHHGCAGRGKAGNYFKKSADISGKASAQKQRHGTDDRDQQPCRRNNDIAVSGVK